MTVNVTLTDHQLTILDSALAFYLENEYFASRPDYYKDVKELKEKVALLRGYRNGVHVGREVEEE